MYQAKYVEPYERLKFLPSRLLLPQPPRAISGSTVEPPITHSPSVPRRSKKSDSIKISSRISIQKRTNHHTKYNVWNLIALRTISEKDACYDDRGNTFPLK